MREADYVCVLDTGSEDDTYEKLQSIPGIICGQEIVTPWRFDTARNLSLDLVPQDANILVCTDLDEVFEPGWTQPLREYWQDGVERAMYKYTWSHNDDGSEGRTFYYDKIHSRNWKWRYPVHEALYNIYDDRLGTKDCNTINLFDFIHLHHYPDMNKSRLSYLPLLEQRKKEYPDDIDGLIYLAHEYSYRGYREEGNQQLEEITHLDIDALTKASCYLFMGDNYMHMGMPHEALMMYNKGVQCDKTYRECYVGAAKACMDLEMYKLARVYLIEALKNTYRHYTWLERDTTWTYEVWDMLCLVEYYSDDGDKKKSFMYAAKALSYLPEEKRLIDNLKECCAAIDDKELIDG
nr:MAG TPA: Tetratricopeptide repeat [Caudoviricetes sp.]